MTNEWSPICYPIDTMITLGDAIKERIEADEKINEKEVVIPIDKQLRHSLPECGYMIVGGKIRAYENMLFVEAFDVYKDCFIKTKTIIYKMFIERRAEPKFIFLAPHDWYSPHRGTVEKRSFPKTLKVKLYEAIEVDGGNPLNMKSTLSQDDLEDCLDDQLEWTAWCDDWVYFPVMYDGQSWIGSVPSKPCDYKTSPQGGG